MPGRYPGVAQMLDLCKPVTSDLLDERTAFTSLVAARLKTSSTPITRCSPSRSGCTVPMSCARAGSWRGTRSTRWMSRSSPGSGPHATAGQAHGGRGRRASSDEGDEAGEAVRELVVFGLAPPCGQRAVPGAALVVEHAFEDVLGVGRDILKSVGTRVLLEGRRRTIDPHHGEPGSSLLQLGARQVRQHILQGRAPEVEVAILIDEDFPGKRGEYAILKRFHARKVCHTGRGGFPLTRTKLGMRCGGSPTAMDRESRSMIRLFCDSVGLRRSRTMCPHVGPPNKASIMLVQRGSLAILKIRLTLPAFCCISMSVVSLVVLAGCDTREPPEAIDSSRFITVPVHDPTAIARISRFRSSVGHDFSDDSETCRSMKHYFAPPDGADWSALEIRAPFSGRVVAVESEWAGDKVELMPDSAPEFRLTIFHVVRDPDVRSDAKVRAGDRLGRHAGRQTMSDVAVWSVPAGGLLRLVSYFDLLSDDAFGAYRAVGIESRALAIIDRGLRDAAPLNCGADERFLPPLPAGDAPDDWLTLGG